MNRYNIYSMTSRTQQILKLVLTNSQPHTQNETNNQTDDYNNSTAQKELSIIGVAENVSPNINIIHTSQENDHLNNISSCDEILSDNTGDLGYQIDSRFISSRKEGDNSDNEIETTTTLPKSLVPDYDSENSSIYNETDQNIKESLPESSSSSSPSSSSSSSSTSSSSSDSDSSVPVKQSNQSEDVSDANILNSTEKNTEHNIPILPSTSQSADNNLYDNHLRSRTFNTDNLSRTTDNNPVFSDESENVDLSDDDPTFSYELSINNNKTRNYFFNTFNSVVPSTDTSDSDNGSSSGVQSAKKGRKRSRNPKKWKQNKTKRLRNTGESYVSTSKSRKIVPSRCLKLPCTDKCKLKCTENISHDERHDIFKEFWDLGDIARQRTFISNCMVDIVPKYKYTNAKNPRRPNKAFNFTVKNKKIRVCKTFFKSTLDVTDRMIFTVQTKVSEGGFMLEDLRGKHSSHKTLNPQLVDDIRRHIQSIPKIESHYVRATSTKQYIDGGKTIKDLYNDFVKQQEENRKESGNYIAYYKIFTTEFNLSFFQPKKDQCDFCLSYNNSNDDKKTELEGKYKLHLEERTLSRTEKQQDRTNITKDDKVAIYDLEAVLQCPRGDSSAFYYKSKLNSYNLTLTELTKTNSKTAYDKVHCYFWTEFEAKRGAIEIGTCIWQYLEGICEESANEKKVTFYSDNCCGQNKNKYIATLYLYATQTLNIRKITHKFLITGHTQNEADSVHSLIEKEVKKNLKSGPIYTPDQYIALIKNAKKSKPALIVHEQTYESFLDIKELQEQWGYNYNINTDGQAVKWNDIKVLMMEKDKPFSIFYKTSYKEESYQEVDVRNKRKKMKEIREITVKKAYTQRQNLSMNKKKDLQELVNKGMIPPFYAHYYSLIVN